MGASNATPFRCALLTPPLHARRWPRWLDLERKAGWIELHTLEAEALSAQSMAETVRAHPAAPFDALLLIVARAALPWARGRLATLGSGSPPVIAISEDSHPECIRAMLRIGVRDFLLGPCRREELELRLWRVREAQRPLPAASAPPARAHPLLRRFIGTSTALARQVDLIPVIAACDAGVLIVGETGTGKEMFAQSIHYLSTRSDHPWVAVNCAVLPAELVEAELFGHTRGAYTSANEARCGLVAEAEGGTLFLDEVDSLPLAAQAKLLRFLQEKEYRAVGSSKVRRADVRVIAASNGELESLVRDGRFRRDLFYRLNVLRMRLPPLRERMEDVVVLSADMTARFARELRRPVRGLSEGALARLACHDWPGNVRELEHTLERAVLLCGGEVLEATDLDLPEASAAQELFESFKAAKARMVESFERVYIERMLILCSGNITQAAQASAKNRRAFWQLIRKHRIDARRFHVSEGA